jgi:hypothetical protein
MDPKGQIYGNYQMLYTKHRFKMTEIKFMITPSLLLFFLLFLCHASLVSTQNGGH